MEVDISVRGRLVRVPALQLDGVTIVTEGKWLKIASIHDEDWFEGDLVKNPESLIASIKNQQFDVDIFTFAERFATRAHFPYSTECDNIAVVPITSYKEWWEKRLPQETRRNVRIAAKRGVVVKVVPFNDELVRGILEIYNETALRAGRPFWHYGKSFDDVKRENSSYLERGVFLGAFHGAELIGFIKMVKIGKVASIMQILAKNSHADKKTSNALIAKAVEVCANDHISHLEYCKYSYGNDEKSLLTEFKRRNGFERLNFPRYYIALNWKGALAMKLKLHLGLREILPCSVLALLLDIRARINKARVAMFPVGNQLRSKTTDLTGNA